jgi:hypothetical protein
LYDKALGTVTEILQGAITKVNFSFDLWTSKNRLALLGVCAHFINNAGNTITTLLALPRQKGRHSGTNIADAVSSIIAEYDLSDKLGYFTTDNASSNDKALALLGIEYGFDYKQRWVRCAGHIFNLVGQATLFGSDNNAFVDELEDITVEEAELRHWRKKGPIGKLHNLVTRIVRSTLLSERLEALQRELITPNRPHGYKEVYELVRDVITRWLSFVDCASRALYLRAAIDELLFEERRNYEAYCHRCAQSNRRITKQPPPILQDALNSDDWNVIKLYCEILEPVKEAVKMLQGHAGGHFGAIWQVLPAYEKVLRHFEQLVVQYPVGESLESLEVQEHSPTAFNVEFDDVAKVVADLPEHFTTAEHHLSTNIRLGWQKLNEYYTRLDDNSIYVAAVVLHPRMKWSYLEKRWQERPNWLVAAKTSFNQLWLDYQYNKAARATPEQQPSPPKQARRTYDWLSDDDVSDDEATSVSSECQLSEYLQQRRSVDLKIEDSPVNYWLSRQRQWPRLASLALDIFSTPVMSDEPERVFSTAGAAVSPRRRLLHGTTISYTMCLKSWIARKVIVLDRYDVLCC